MLTLRQQTRLYEIIEDLEHLKFDRNEKFQTIISAYKNYDELINEIRKTIEKKDGLMGWQIINRYTSQGLQNLLEYLKNNLSLVNSNQQIMDLDSKL